MMWGLRFGYWRGAEPDTLARRYYGASPMPRATLQIFAKPPLPGLVKTRLAATIGDDAAAAVYRDLVLRTLGIAVSARRAGIVRDLELWIAPDADPGPLATWGEQLQCALRSQRGANLGERMRNALQSSLVAGSPALLIGTDVPAFDIPYLARAAAALQANDAVVGPAEDGGYVLIGLAREVEAFDGIRWGTPDVMAETRAKLAAAGIGWPSCRRCGTSIPARILRVGRRSAAAKCAPSRRRSPDRSCASAERRVRLTSEIGPDNLASQSS